MAAKEAILTYQEQVAELFFGKTCSIAVEQRGNWINSFSPLIVSG